MYKIAAAYATALYVGMPVLRDASGDIITYTAGAGNYLIGSALGFFTTDFAPLATSYYTAALAGVHYALVADDPEQLYQVQEDGLLGTIALIDLGQNLDLVATTAGSTFNGMAGAELDSNTIAAGATGQMRLIDIVRTAENEVGSAHCKWVCKINYHQGLQGTVGVGV
jgi:hypothetical protein